MEDGEGIGGISDYCYDDQQRYVYTITRRKMYANLLLQHCQLDSVMLPTHISQSLTDCYCNCTTRLLDYSTPCTRNP